MKKSLFLPLLFIFLFSGIYALTPTINLVGDNPVNVNVGSIYTDAGATLNNFIPLNEGPLVMIINGDVVFNFTITITNNVDTSRTGSYTVIYSALDSDGNVVATATRNVNVADTTAPVITLNGNNPLAIETNTTSYTELGATATDNVDGDLTSNIIISGLVDTNTLGTYFVNYTVSDSAGNTATVTREVDVVYIPPASSSNSGGGSNTGEVNVVVPVSNSTNNNQNTNSIQEKDVPVLGENKVILTGSAVLSFAKSGFGIGLIIFIIVGVFVLGIFIARKKRYLQHGY